MEFPGQRHVWKTSVIILVTSIVNVFLCCGNSPRSFFFGWEAQPTCHRSSRKYPHLPCGFLVARERVYNVYPAKRTHFSPPCHRRRGWHGTAHRLCAHSRQAAATRVPQGQQQCHCQTALCCDFGYGHGSCLVTYVPT